MKEMINVMLDLQGGGMGAVGKKYDRFWNSDRIPQPSHNQVP